MEAVLKLKILVQTKEACCSETLIFPTCAIKRKEKIEVMLDSTFFTDGLTQAKSCQSRLRLHSGPGLKDTKCKQRCTKFPLQCCFCQPLPSIFPSPTLTQRWIKVGQRKTQPSFCHPVGKAGDGACWYMGKRQLLCGLKDLLHVLTMSTPTAV